VYFIFTTLVEVIDIWLPRWAAYLIITVFMLLIAGILAMIGIRKMKTVEPTPKRAIAQAEQTVSALKSATENPGSMPPARRPDWDRVLESPAPAATPAITDSSRDA
jgi:hypothetical protein